MHLSIRPRSSSRAQAATTIVVAAGLALTISSPAVADGGLGWTTCTNDGSAPWCEVGASSPPSPGSPVSAQAASARRANGAGGSRECWAAGGEVIPCYDPKAGSLASDGCYYKAAMPSADVQMALGGAGQGPGGWFDYVCPGTPGTGGGTRWIAGAPPVPVAAAVSPEVLARQALSRLDLPALTIRMSPTDVQLVRLPTWLWVDPAVWKPHTANAAVPGVSVTATATPARVVWSTGDGASTTCSGPGTPWPGGDPAAASPTCGHTYTRGSASAPGGVFAVTATVSWSISWAGGGQAGALPVLATTATTTVRVAEVQAVVVTG